MSLCLPPRSSPDLAELASLPRSQPIRALTTAAHPGLSLVTRTPYSRLQLRYSRPRHHRHRDPSSVNYTVVGELQTCICVYFRSSRALPLPTGGRLPFGFSRCRAHARAPIAAVIQQTMINSIAVVVVRTLTNVLQQYHKTVMINVIETRCIILIFRLAAATTAPARSSGRNTRTALSPFSPTKRIETVARRRRRRRPHTHTQTSTQNTYAHTRKYAYTNTLVHVQTRTHAHTRLRVHAHTHYARNSQPLPPSHSSIVDPPLRILPPTQPPTPRKDRYDPCRFSRARVGTGDGYGYERKRERESERERGG